MYSQFSLARKPLEDGPASGIGESFKKIVRYSSHVKIITKWLLIVKQ